MPKPELTQFIIEELAKGEGKQEITNKLLFKGWKIEEINEAFASVNEQPSHPTPPQNAPQVTNAHVFTNQEQASNQTQNPIDINRLPGIKELLSEAWKIEQDRFKTLAAIILWPFLILIVGIILSIIGAFSGQLALVLTAIPFLLLALFLFISSRLALIIAIKGRAEKVNFKTAFFASFGKVIPLIVLSIIMGVIFLVGFFLLIIPAFIFGIWFSFAVFALASDDAGIIDSLKLSKSYVNGKFFAVLYRNLGLGAIIMLASLIIGVIPLINIISPFINVLVLTPLAVIYNYLLYENLKKLEGKEITNHPGILFKAFVILLMATIALCIIVFFGFIIPNLIKNYKPPTRINVQIMQNQGNSTINTPFSNGAASATNSALDLQRFHDITVIQNALDTYYLDNKKYPNNLSQLAPDYVSTVPTDPSTKKLYTYQMENFTQPDYLLCGIFDNQVQKCFSTGVRSSTYSR